MVGNEGVSGGDGGPGNGGGCVRSGARIGRQEYCSMAPGQHGIVGYACSDMPSSRHLCQRSAVLGGVFDSKLCLRANDYIVLGEHLSLLARRRRALQTPVHLSSCTPDMITHKTSPEDLSIHPLQLQALDSSLCSRLYQQVSTILHRIRSLPSGADWNSY